VLAAGGTVLTGFDVIIEVGEVSVGPAVVDGATVPVGAVFEPAPLPLNESTVSGESPSDLSEQDRAKATVMKANRRMLFSRAKRAGRARTTLPDFPTRDK
jgi:hypothetical protein